MSDAVQQRPARVAGAVARQRIGIGVIGFGWLGRAHTRSYFTGPFQYFGFFSSTTRCPRSQLANLNGPVPTGALG